jgi:hypothetical protein
MKRTTVFSRREFSKMAAATVVAPSMASRFLEAVKETPGVVAWPRYEQVMVVDFLASPGPFNTPVNVEALTPDMVRNAQASGITAVNLTSVAARRKACSNRWRDGSAISSGTRKSF